MGTKLTNSIRPILFVSFLHISETKINECSTLNFFNFRMTTHGVSEIKIFI